MQTPALLLRRSEAADLEAVRAAYARSVSLHQPWTYPPRNLEASLREEHRYLLCLAAGGEIVGTFNISGIVRGYFHSAYLGYEAYVPHQGKGYMRRGLQLLLQKAFGELNLHRLEANIQPENKASIALVRAAGFVREGYSRQYLNIGGRGWKDHERWAILNPDWRDPDAA